MTTQDLMKLADSYAMHKSGDDREGNYGALAPSTDARQALLDALERFAKSLIKLGRNSGSEEAKQKCKQLEVAIDGATNDISDAAGIVRAHGHIALAERLVRYAESAHPQALEQTQGELGEVIGCFDAAIAEGLYDAIAETSDERLKDLLERRVMHAYYKAIGPSITHPQVTEPAPSNQQDNRFYREKSNEQTPSTELPGMWDTSDFTGGATDMPAPSTAGEADMHARFKAKHQFLEWNRAQPEPLVKIAYEYGVFDKAMSLYAALLSAPALPPESGNLCVNCAADGKCMKRQALCHANGTAMPVGELTDSDIRKIWSDICAEWADKGGNPYLKYARAILAAARTQPAREPLTGAHYFAMREAYQVAAADQYFVARLQIDTSDRRRVYEAGFNRGFEDGAAHGITKKGEAKEQTP